MQPWKVSLAVIGIGLAVLLVIVPHVVLIVFAGLLMAAFLNGPGRWIGRRGHIPTGAGIAIFSILLVAALAVVFTVAARGIAGQINELLNQLPQALNNLRDVIGNYPWVERALDRFNPEQFLSGSRDAASTAVSSTFGALGNAVIIIFIGIYVAIDPALYRKGTVLLLAPSIRSRADEVLVDCADKLKSWLGAQLISMTVVGTLTAIGLWLIGVPLALILGLIAGLFAFIPNIGPVLAIVPGLLLALSGGLTMVFWVAAVYLTVQALESYVITPLVQQERVALAPALIIAGQLLLGILFGLLGLALAMPLLAVAMTLANEVYIDDYLEGGARRSGLHPPR